MEMTAVIEEPQCQLKCMWEITAVSWSMFIPVTAMQTEFVIWTTKGDFKHKKDLYTMALSGSVFLFWVCNN